jgi:hypothetical protein
LGTLRAKVYRADLLAKEGRGSNGWGAVNLNPLLNGTRVVKIKADEMGNARRTHWSV